MFSKLLVANRGEIAIRAFRAAYELGMQTVAVYPYEDRNSLHRIKADESYQIGQMGHPVRAYLSVDEIVAVARSSGADAVYPGYGFLSENPELAAACAEHGLTFVGPPACVLELAGNKSRAVAAAAEAGLSVLSASPASADADYLLDQASALSFPVFVKAVAGGGGRGMRRVDRIDDLPAAIAAAGREANAAFGDPTVFLEQAVIDPRHIEVQILADQSGDVIHLFERDCSLQRRHQKVIEIAPAPNLDPAVRERICADAVAFAAHIGYSGAGTVEFLVDPDGHHAFIEMNPRIQVEHTVTEEITDVDLVAAQLRIAGGQTLSHIGLAQERITVRGVAVQCRITCEDTENGFRPDTGRITAYRTPGGAGVRLDGSASLGTEVSAHFDSLLVKLTCRSGDFPSASARARRALAEFRIRGIATNIGFLQAVLDSEDFLAGRVTTAFIDAHPQLQKGRPPSDRGTKLLTYLADVTVNQPYGPAATFIDTASKLPTSPTGLVPDGSRQQLLALGPEGFARSLRRQTALGVCDTTYRDAHQSLLATRVRGIDLLAGAAHMARVAPQLLSMEVWGGATYDVALRFLHEDPWQRLADFRAAVPNICLQMLLRGRNTVGYTSYPVEVTKAFVREATTTGIDIFRIFDALNNVDQMRVAIDAVRDSDTAVAEVALCYTGNLLDPAENLYTMDYYLKLAARIVDAGAHILTIKDMAGLLRPAAAEQLVSALRREFDLPVRVHTHDTPGGQLAAYHAAWRAGADAVDGAAAPLSGNTSQPALSAIVAASAHTDRDTGIDLGALTAAEPYWEAVRTLYAPFESGIPAPTGRVYQHEIPGGQLSNLRQQAAELGLGQKFEQVETQYADVDRVLGRLIKVTPSSKAVGDLALALVAVAATADEFAAGPGRFDIPDSVLGFLRGDLGTPVGGWPEPLRTHAVGNRAPAIEERAVSPDDLEKLHADATTRRQTLNALLFPGPTLQYTEHRRRYGDTSVLPTRQFLYGLQAGEEVSVALEPGVTLQIGLEAVSDPDERGQRTVVCLLNGQIRPLTIRDRHIADLSPAAEKADPSNPAHLGAPFSGTVTLSAADGDPVNAGDAVGTLEAMKMEVVLTAPRAGAITRIAIDTVAAVDGGDLLMIID